MLTSYSQTWDLNSLFDGGSQSPLLQNELHTLKEDLKNLKQNLEQSSDLTLCIQSLQEIEMRCMELESFIACLIAQDVSDELAIQLNNEIISLRAEIEIVSTQFNMRLLALSDFEFDKLLEKQGMKPIAFSLQERRVWAKEKLPLQQESLINRLSIDGYHGWSELYNALMGQTKILFKQEDKVVQLSVGQAESKLSHPDRHIRQTLFQDWVKTWQSQEQVFAQILNHLAGFRLKVYEERGWDTSLKEPLFCNRMKEDTLNMMWQVIEDNKHPLLAYLSKKAQLLGLTQLAWFDVEASLPNAANQALSFQAAAETIITQFNKFSPSMANFAREAFEKKWIETEDRPGKMPGGFCSQHPKSKQSRIFMTYGNTMSNVFTLAHELGHAYHNHAVKDLPNLAQQYRMNVAETASTLAEMVLVDSLIKKSNNLQEKRALLDSKLQRAVIFLMNIHARFLFETRFYQARKKGTLTAGQLNHLMEEAQREAFLDGLSEWHPHFWIAKRHFYITEVPFYNFPYTFGYLFSLGLYAHALKEPSQFEQHYEALLRDTACMDVETLAQKHLGVDLTQSVFWENGLDLIKQDVESYVKLVN
jgi:oligoendopeptidase F